MIEIRVVCYMIQLFVQYLVKASSQYKKRNPSWPASDGNLAREFECWQRWLDEEPHLATPSRAAIFLGIGHILCGFGVTRSRLC